MIRRAILLLALVGCMQPAPIERDSHELRWVANGEVAVLAATAKSGETLTLGQLEAGFPIDVCFESDSIVCRRTDEGSPIHFMTFERAGDESAYGVYGLGGYKSHMPVDYPLRGEPIAWGHRDSKQALAHLFVLDGFEASSAAEVVAEASSRWFAEGVGVFFVVPKKLAPSLQTETAAKALLIHVELAD